MMTLLHVLIVIILFILLSSVGLSFKSELKEARKGFFGCLSVCETMKDTKEE